MPTPSITYPLDITGAALSNKVLLEQHIVTANNYKDYFFVVPKFAPFFITNLAITHTVNGVNRPLIEGVDFLPILPFVGASRSIGVPLYSGVSFTNLSITGIVSFTYQTIGGDWLFDDQQVLTNIANQAYNPRITSWEQVTGLPTLFPVTNHAWNLTDLIGQTELLNKLTDIQQAILQQATNAVNLHLTNLSNPHGVTKAQVGLGSVENYPPATTAQALAGVAGDKLITPLTLQQVLSLFLTQIPTVPAGISSHLLDHNNPHQVTKAQVGLGSVENYPIASIAEAKGRVASDRLITPEKLAYVFDDFLTQEVIPLIPSLTVISNLNSHVNNSNNPHGVTKDQVGLGLVENYGPATTAQALAGVAGDKLITPLTLESKLQNFLSTSIAPEFTNINNQLTNHTNIIDTHTDDINTINATLLTLSVSPPNGAIGSFAVAFFNFPAPYNFDLVLNTFVVGSSLFKSTRSDLAYNGGTSLINNIYGLPALSFNGVPLSGTWKTILSPYAIENVIEGAYSYSFVPGLFIRVA